MELAVPPLCSLLKVRTSQFSNEIGTRIELDILIALMAKGKSVAWRIFYGTLL
jgi:hypothetical protein